MKLKQHIVYGGVASLCLVPKFGFLSGVFWAATVLIDVDHYIDFICRNRFTSFNIKQMFIYYDIMLDWKDRQGFLGLNIFHTIEIIIGIYLISLWANSGVFNAIFWGMVYHMLLDIFHLFNSKCLFGRAYSLIEYFIRKKMMIHNGILPNEIYDEMVTAVSNKYRINKGIKGIMKKS